MWFTLFAASEFLQTIFWMKFCNKTRWVVFNSNTWLWVYDIVAGLVLHQVKIPRIDEIQDYHYDKCKYIFLNHEIE